MNTEIETPKLAIIIMAVVGLVTMFLIHDAFAQTPPPPPPLESKPVSATEPSTSTTSLGKITIQISQTEQIVIDLPLKADNKYQVIPIK